MDTILKAAGLALGSVALSATAAAQEGQNPYQSSNPVISASLGDNDNFTGVVDPAAGELCYILNAGEVDSPTGARITDEAGNPVVTLETPEDGASGECKQIDPALAQALGTNAENYHVEVASATYPDGEVRGQLSGGRPTAG